ncbi:hypothetical protein OG552_14470 [Streptomyces sp. NBC_01476]|uniref:hypothetical protein n=1 Tax=Streptomyces sp. NBC_01476 TaxID=2903881 RepID=UPI002E36FC2D|nr:hypothetical protein [Streptomyces sp. NBC_01476]
MSTVRTAAGQRARPRDWHPLADGDPVPGDPGAILEEVEHLKHVAAMLRTEASDLRTITGGRGLKGRYADALRDGARELEVRLRETAERYERVQGELTHWADELEGFQTEAGRILLIARDAAPEDTTAQRTSLAKITAQRDHRAAHYASRLRHEIDDTIKDSWWDRCKDAIDSCQGVISFVVDVMSWVATGIAIAAITMTPAGWVAGLAVWLTFGVLAGHLLLASAGDGSWADITMDLFGLLTMRVGAAALTSLRNVRDATKLAAELAAQERAAEASARATRALRDRASAVVNRRGATRAERAMARHNRNIARAATRRAANAAFAAEAAVPLPEASRWEAAVVGGERETANLHKDVLRLRAAYPDSPEVQRASVGAEGHKRVFQGTWIAATALDAADKGAGSSDLFPWKTSYGRYGDAKNRYVREVGSQW